MSSLTGRFEMKLFVYGTLKPGEPGNDFFRQHNVQISSKEEAHLKGFALYDWDGLPIAMAASDNTSRTRGYLLEIRGDDAPGVLDKLDKYECGDGEHTRPLKRQKVTVSTKSGDHEAWVFAFDESSSGKSAAARLRRSGDVADGNWTMAEDAIFKSIFPVVYRNLQLHLVKENGLSLDKNHVELLGQFLVLYSCLERFCLHRFGPRRYNFAPRPGRSGDRASVQKLLHEEYFATGASQAWFHPQNKTRVYDSTTMRNFSLSKKPTFFWATVRNNSAHQGKSDRAEHVQLLRVAAASLADFLALALINLKIRMDSQSGSTGEILDVSLRLKETWVRKHFSPTANNLQSLLASRIT